MLQTERPWNLLIPKYVKSGKPQHAVNLFQRLEKEDCKYLNGRTFVALLKACTRLNDLKTGTDIHAYVASHSSLLESDLYVGTTLVDMYAKCGSITKAKQVFDLLPNRGIVTWTALIAGYTEHGCSRDALKCYQRMQSEGVSPNVVTFGCCLKACVHLGLVGKGQEIHAEIERKGLLKNDLFIGSSLVDMYAKSGLLTKAREVFGRIPTQDVVSWTALIAGYSDRGYGEESLSCFKQMKLEGVSPNIVTFICSLKACGILGDCGEGREIHAEIERKGLLRKDTVIGNALIDMYFKCGLLSMAQTVFDMLQVRDVISWTALITGYAAHDYGEEAMRWFGEMQRGGISPNNVTFLSGLKACYSIGITDEVGGLLRDIERTGLLERDCLVGNTLVYMYAKHGLMSMAQNVFDKLPSQDVVTWTALISGYNEHGQGDNALECFEQMQAKGILLNAVTLTCGLKACGSIGASCKGQQIHTEIKRYGLLEKNHVVGNSLVDMYARCGLLTSACRVFDELPTQDVVTWAALMTGYVEHERGKEAIKLFDQMCHNGVAPDLVSFMCALRACGIIGALEKGVKIHGDIERQGLLHRNLAVGNTLVDMYAKSGAVAKAQEVLERLPRRDVVSWNALLAGYVQVGNSDHCFLVLDRMVGEGIWPDKMTFLVILSACSRMGLYDESETYLEAMSKEYGLIPALEHHASVIDILGRVGKLDRAIKTIKKMPLCPNVVVWNILLGASRSFGDVESGEEAFQQALRLDANDAVPYILMSRMYADVLVWTPWEK